MMIKLGDSGRYVAADQVAEIQGHYDRQQITVRLKDGRELGIHPEYGGTVGQTVDRLVTAVNAALGE